MLEEFGNYLVVYISSMVKFVAGPVLGAASGMNYWETLIFTVMGMMTTVLIISFFGPQIRKWWVSIFGVRKRKKFNKRNRRFIKLWRKYGEFGISFLTPVIFSPIIGTLVITSLGGRRNKIISYMLISATFWASTLFLLGESISKVFSPIFN